MKRNHPPKNAEESAEERRIINDLLKDFYAKSTDGARRVPIANKGIWLDDKRHVKVESTKGLPANLVKYSRHLKYEYLNPFEALYCLECNQLLILCNDFPLSLSEAYELLLKDSDGRSLSRNYRVFQLINRSGWICLEPSTIDRDASEVVSESKQVAEGPLNSGTAGASDSCPNFDINQSDHFSFKEILNQLSSLGPKELDETTFEPPADDYKYTFDVYKRETYAMNKPSKSKRNGTPDYHLLVYAHEPSQKPPDCKQLIGYSKHLSAKLLIALIDADYSICYTQFTPITAFDLALI